MNISRRVGQDFFSEARITLKIMKMLQNLMIFAKEFLKIFRLVFKQFQPKSMDFGQKNDWFYMILGEKFFKIWVSYQARNTFFFVALLVHP